MSGVFLTAHEPGDLAAAHAGRSAGQRPRDLAKLGLPADTDAYIAVRRRSWSAVTDALVAAGLPASRVHTELFGTLAAVNPGVVGARQVRPHPPATEGSGPEITFARSGLTVRWSEEYGSPAGTGRGLRRAGALVVPDGSVPHVRDGAARR